MKKLKLVGMLAAVVMLMFIVVASYLSEKNVDEPEELFVVPVTRDELFISSEEGYNSIEIYKQENKLVINAQSEAAFFDGVQFTVEIEGENSTGRCRNHLDDYRRQYGICRRQ